MKVVKVVIVSMLQCLPSWSSANHFVTSSGVKPANPPRERIVLVCSCSKPRTKSSSNGLEIGSSVWSKIARELQKELRSSGVGQWSELPLPYSLVMADVVVCVRSSWAADAAVGMGCDLRTAFDRFNVHLLSVLGGARVCSSVAARVSEAPTNDADEGTSVALANKATTECEVWISVAMDRRLLSPL